MDEKEYYTMMLREIMDSGLLSVGDLKKEIERQYNKVYTLQQIQTFRTTTNEIIHNKPEC